MLLEYCKCVGHLKSWLRFEIGQPATNGPIKGKGQDGLLSQKAETLKRNQFYHHGLRDVLCCVNSLMSSVVNKFTDLDTA